MQVMLIRRPSGGARRVACALLIIGALVALFAPKTGAQVGSQGQWQTLSGQVPANINPVHMALMNNGSVLMVAGSGNLATDTTFESIVWDPQTRSFVASQTWSWDMFCNGMVVLPDGRVFVNGGNLAYDPFKGERQ